MRGSSQSTVAPVTLRKPTVAEHLYKYKERYLLLLPAIVLFIVFRYVPMAGIVLAWKRFTVTGGPRDEYAFKFFGGAEGETWEVDDRGYAVSIPGTGSAKDGAEGTRLGARMLIGHAAHIVPPVDKVYIAPNRHALQAYFEQNQAPGPPIGFRPTWDEAERALRLARKGPGFGLPTTVPRWCGMLSREGRQFMEMAPRLGPGRNVAVGLFPFNGGLHPPVRHGRPA